MSKSALLMEMLWTVSLHFINRAKKVIYPEHPVVIFIWSYSAVHRALRAICTPLSIFPRWSGRILSRLIWPHSVPRSSPPAQPLAASNVVPVTDASVSTGIYKYNLQKSDSHWFSDLYTHQHQPLTSSGPSAVSPPLVSCFSSITQLNLTASPFLLHLPLRARKG